MGLRGPGAKPKGAKKSGKGMPKLREELPWEVEGLTRLERVIAFLEDLPITQGKLAGQKLKLRQWQIDEFLAPVYATDDMGNRPVRTAALSMGRKNGKTGLSAGLALCHLVGPEAEERGEIYFCAMDKAQAAKAWSECKAMLEQHAELSLRVNIIRFSKEIEVLEGDGAGSVLKAVSADADSKLGLSPSFVLCDEAGYWAKRDLFDAMDSALGAREEPLIVVISTQAKSDSHFFSEMVDYGLKIKAGEIEDETFHLAFFSAPEDADPWDEKTWAKANPAMGDFNSIEQIARLAEQAKRIPSKEQDFRNKILNQRVDSHVRFIAKREWDDCNKSPIGSLAAYEGRECYGGLDLSAARDLTGWVLVFPNDDGTVDVVPRFFLPEFDIDGKSENDRVPYNVWARQDAARLTLIPGKVIDPAVVAEWIADDAARFDIKAIAYDRWRIEDLKRELDKLSVELPLVPFGQGYKDMSPAVDTLEVMVAQQRINHGGNPLLNMCAANAVVTSDPAGARKLDKSKASGRIDGIVALAMALSTVERHEEEDDELPACLTW